MERQSVATLSKADWSLPVSESQHPSEAKCAAVSSPMPDDAPVIRATLFRKSGIVEFDSGTPPSRYNARTNSTNEMLRRLRIRTSTSWRDSTVSTPLHAGYLRSLSRSTAHLCDWRRSMHICAYETTIGIMTCFSGLRRMTVFRLSELLAVDGRGIECSRRSADVTPECRPTAVISARPWTRRRRVVGVRAPSCLY